jgi:cell division transport system permease protein
MCTIETAMADSRIVGRNNTSTRMLGLLPRGDTPIVPRDTIAGRALVAVVAIMTFLCSLTVGAVMQVRTAAIDWQSAVAREITVQVRPVDGRDIEAEVKKATDIVRAFPGIAEVRPYSRNESAGLLEPWLGSGFSPENLPLPRIIALRRVLGADVDLVRLRKELTERVAGASLDDHRAWISYMRTMASSAVTGGLAVLLLMLAATVMSVTFATRGAMATNRAIIEVLYFIGAKHRFIAGQFQRHFLMLGLQGGVIGGGVAVLLFLVAAMAGPWVRGTAGGEQFAAMFGSLDLGIDGYLAIVGVVILIAAVTTITSRRTVNHALKAME